MTHRIAVIAGDGAGSASTSEVGDAVAAEVARD